MRKSGLLITALFSLTAYGFADTPAPTLQVSGYLETGARMIKSNSFFGSGLYGDLFNDNTASPGGRFDLIGNYTSGNNGVTFKLRTDENIATYPATSAYSAPVVYNAYAWSYLGSQKAFMLKGGIVSDSTFGTLGDYGFFMLDSAPGVELSWFPASGWTVAGFMSAPSYQTSSSASFWDNPWFVGLAYSSSSFSFNAGWTYGTTTPNAYGTLGTNSGITGLDNVTASLSYTNGSLFAAAEYCAVNLNNYSSLGYSFFTQKLTYNVGSVTPGVTLYEYLDGNTNAVDASNNKATLGWHINPFIDYAVDKVTTLELGATYFAGVQQVLVNGTTDYLPSSASLSAMTENNQAQLDIKPRVFFNLASDTYIAAYYLFSTSVGADKTTFNGTNDSFSNTFGLDLRYTF